MNILMIIKIIGEIERYMIQPHLKLFLKFVEIEKTQTRSMPITK